MAYTYEPINTNTVSGSSTTSITFSSIPATYTDLILATYTSGATSDGGALKLQFNSDTGGNYSSIFMYGTGSSAVTSKPSNQAFIYAGRAPLNNWGPGLTHIMNYANTSTYKTALSRGNSITQFTLLYCGTWRNTSAINTLTIGNEAGTAFADGSTFTLYGILAA